MSSLVGYTVLYTLNAIDAAVINERRQSPLTPVAEGEVYPMIIMKAVAEHFASPVNGMLFPDGWDLHRVTNVSRGIGPGTWTGIGS